MQRTIVAALLAAIVVFVAGYAIGRDTGGDERAASGPEEIQAAGGVLAPLSSLRAVVLPDLRVVATPEPEPPAPPSRVSPVQQVPAQPPSSQPPPAAPPAAVQPPPPPPALPPVDPPPEPQ
jgi:hypothetical protein